jgi:DNA-binding NarL/FixJ family response regulator
MAVDWPQLRVLIADDQRFLLGILFHIFKELGVRSENIHQATNGDDAAKMLAAVPVDVVVCDINMGPGSGLHLLRGVRSGQAQTARDLPVVLVTGHADAATVKLAQALDANGFIVKPVAKKQMQDKIEGVLANRRPLPAGKNYAGMVIELSESVKAAAAMDGSIAAREEKAAQGAEKPKTEPSPG